MQVSRPLIEKEIHPSVIVNSYFKALEEASKILND